MKSNNGQPNPPRNPSGSGGIGHTVPEYPWVPEYDGLGRCGECGNVHSPNDGMIDYKQMYEEEARKFQQETRRTSELSVMIDRGLEVLRAQGHTSDQWTKACTICDWMRDAKALREKPINA